MHGQEAAVDGLVRAFQHASALRVDVGLLLLGAGEGAAEELNDLELLGAVGRCEAPKNVRRRWSGWTRVWSQLRLASAPRALAVVRALHGFALDSVHQVSAVCNPPPGAPPPPPASPPPSSFRSFFCQLPAPIIR